MNLNLAPGLLDQMIQHARSCYPQEGCGLLSGTQGGATRFTPVRNIVSSESEYEMDPAELISEIRTIRDSGMKLLAIYHSHPAGSARPSKTDIERAYYPDTAYIIVSMANPDHPQVAAFRIIGGEVFNVELHAIV